MRSDYEYRKGQSSHQPQQKERGTAAETTHYHQLGDCTAGEKCTIDHDHEYKKKVAELDILDRTYSCNQRGKTQNIVWTVMGLSLAFVFLGCASLRFAEAYKLYSETRPVLEGRDYYKW